MNIIVTFDTKIIDVVFNDQQIASRRKEGIWLKDKVTEISIAPENYISIIFDGTTGEFQISASTEPIEGTLLVDQVAGVVPTDNDHLLALLISNIFS